LQVNLYEGKDELEIFDSSSPWVQLLGGSGSDLLVLAAPDRNGFAAVPNSAGFEQVKSVRR
jgi:hypothetical protein